MNTIYLRFADESAWLNACEVAGYWINQEPSGPLLLSHTHIFDVIGVITEGGEFDPETGEQVTAPTPLDGFHVNAKLQELPEGWSDYVVAPSSPVRMFAGD